MRCVYLALFVSLASLGTTQDDPWVKQAPIPSYGTIMTVAPRSSTDIWCSTAPWPYSPNGHVAHSLDGGGTWTEQELDLGGVTTMFWLDDQLGWTAGGAFRHTTDGGQTWVTDNDWPAVNDLFFLDSQRGWGCGNGGVVYRTVDGGLTWTSILVPAGNQRSIWFTDANNGWAVGDAWGRIIRTTDGGASWTVQAQTGLYLRTIQFLSPTDGWAIGGDEALRTTDGGQTWVPVPLPAGSWVQSARFHDMQSGVGVGEGGQIVRTTDGQTWSTVRPPGSGPRLWDVEYADPQTIVCGGDAGALLRSVDGGATWSQIQSGAWGITRGLDVHSEDLAWACSQAGEIVRTTNGGKLWERYPVAGFTSYSHLHDIEFVDTNVGWTVGRVHNGNGYDGRISGSTDGGLTWTLQADIGFAELMGVAAFDQQRAIAFGWGTLGGTLLRTINGGQNWLGAGPSEGVYRGADTVSTTTGWIAGTHIYKTTNAGFTWTKQWESPTGAHLAAISFADDQHGWACGFANQLLRTTNGGQTWVEQTSGAPPGTGLMGVWAVSPSTAWVVGWNSYVARTTDGGATWQSESIPSAPNAYWECVEFLDEETGWLAGDYGIYKRLGEECFATNYCSVNANSTGQPATMGWAGSCATADQDFTLQAWPVPAQPFLFFFGDAAAEIPFGDSFICVGGTLTRLGSPEVATGGLAERPVDLAAHGVLAGSTLMFQCWFRDPAGGGAGFSSSDGLEVTFQ